MIGEELSMKMRTTRVKDSSFYSSSSLSSSSSTPCSSFSPIRCSSSSPSSSIRSSSSVRSLFPFFILLILCSSPASSAEDILPPRRNEMLVPVNSTTALICEPVFARGAEDGEEEAKWMKDGREMARVNGRSNAVLGAERRSPSMPFGRTTTVEPIPQIGFLVITNTREEDEGEYWCERNEQKGERTRLRVARMGRWGPDRRPRLVRPEGEQPLKQGETLVLECPKAPSAVPAPVINWLFNGERVDFAALNMRMAPNGSLLVHNFGAGQSGHFACEAANFVGRAVSPALFLAKPAPQRSGPSSSSWSSSTSLLVQCLSAYVRNGVLWFLIGCLTTSCVVLAYILGALFLYRLYSLRRDRGPHSWRRSLIATPGFRKVIAPMAERMAAAPPPPYFDSGGASEV